ncbi:response regulator [Allomuricauda sp. d1]|uniref:response regulator n=1 Tax=Allomuricauda sp. d1 TaxID=3136725 RepID=UPI0031DAD250
MKTRIDSIYIVDDDPITVFGIKKVLYDVVECDNVASFENGKEALDALLLQLEQGKEIPDIIFLDINMPVMDGWTFMEEFHKLEINKPIRINIVTSSIDPADHERWLYYRKKSMHFVDYKNKPIFKLTAQDIDYISKAS